MQLFPIRPLAAALVCLGLAGLPALAQSPGPTVQASLSASLAPQASLTEGGAALGAETPLKWELYVVDPNGRPAERVARGEADAVLVVPAGDYELAAMLDLVRVTVPVTLAAGENVAPQLVLNAGLVDLTPELSAGGEVFNGAAVFLTTADGVSMSYIGATRAYVPAGTVNVTVVFDAVRMQAALQVSAGETLTRGFIADAGIAEVSVSTGSLALPEGKVPRIDIFAAPAGPDSPLKMVVYDNLAARRFTLPPGDYIAQALVEGASVKVPFSLKSGDVVPLAIELPVGEISIKAPGATSMALMVATDDMAEPWQMIFSQWDLTALDYIVPEGDYLVENFLESGKVEKTVHVSAGARVVVQMP